MSDPFFADRDATGALEGRVRDDAFVMALRYDDVRRIARDWQTFSSDAPFRVPIPSEADVRSVRQLPIETDPPDHGDYRRLVATTYGIPAAEANAAAIAEIATSLLETALDVDEVELVRTFALPLQSRALAVMLGRSQEEAEEWISWGTHVFHDTSQTGQGHASALDTYLDRAIDDAMDSPGDDFFGRLATATFRGRPLTRDKILGFANLTFAGGRDTLINSTATIVHHLGTRPADRDRVRAEPKLIPLAIEEFMRYYSPLPLLGRVVQEPTDLCGFAVQPDSVVALGFGAANHDPAAFNRPDAFVLDRAPNRHLAFGFGPHFCLGAPHARMVLGIVLRLFAMRVSTIEIVEAKPLRYRIGDVRAQLGFDPLVVSLSA